MNRPKFSVVMPVKDEVERLTQSLPAIYEVDPDEVVLCFDKPAHERSLETAKIIAKAYRAIHKTKFLEVERRSDYKFHQAWVRRKGYLEAKHDVILTVDVDLIINKNVLKTIEKIGKNNVAFCSCQKFQYPSSLGNLWRCITYSIVIKMFKLWQYYYRMRVMMRPFTGLYALYRPYWLDTGELDLVKNLVNPKQKARGEHVSRHMDTPYMAEDTHLHHIMLQKYRCIYLNAIGAVSLEIGFENIPEVQHAVAIYHAQRQRRMIGSIFHAIVHARRHYLPVYFQSKRFLRNEGITGRLDKKVFGGKADTLYEHMVSIVENKSYEPLVSHLLTKESGSLFVDVGAGAGYYSWLLASNFNRVLAFEPFPSNNHFMHQYKNIRKIRNVEILPQAVSNMNGVGKLYMADNPPIQGQSSMDKHWVSQLNKCAEPDYIHNVQVVTLDSILADEQVVDLVKVDVEGLEWKVLGGAKKIMPKVRAWLIEVHDLTAKIKPFTTLGLTAKMNTMVALMEGYGYKCERIDKDHIYCFLPFIFFHHFQLCFLYQTFQHKPKKNVYADWIHVLYQTPL